MNSDTTLVLKAQTGATLDITLNLDPNEFPQLLEADDIQSAVLEIFKVGYQVIHNQVPDDDEDKLLGIKNDIIRHVNYRMDTVSQGISELQGNKELVEELLGAKYNSSIKGNVSEGFVESQFKSQLKDYSYERVNQIDHYADGILRSPSGLVSLIEVKNYGKPVPTKELVKFKNDMTHRAVRYGILVSIKSSIVHQKQIDFEMFEHQGNKYCILYISKLAQEPYKLSMGVLLMEHIFMSDNQKNQMSLSQIKRSVIQSLKEIETVSYETDKLLDSYTEIEKGIRELLEKYYYNLRDYRLSLREKVNTIWSDMLQQLEEVDDELLSVNIMEDKLNEMKKEKHPLYKLFIRLNDVFDKYGIILREDETIGTELKVFGRLHCNKSRAIIKFDPDITIPFSKKPEERHFQFLEILLNECNGSLN